MATHPQPGIKRQKTREGRGDTIDYFQGIDKVEYNNMALPTDTTCYRYYNNAERLNNRPMEEWLKFSVSLTEFKNNGCDNSNRLNIVRPWDDNTNAIDNFKRCIKALFDFCTKLGVKYWTAFDTDLIPYSENWEESKSHLDEITEYIVELSQRFSVKLLWIAPDLYSHSRYASGAMTNNDALTYLQAASQIKKCLEISLKLNTECFLLWPYREGYDSIFQTDVPREMKLFAKLLKTTVDYKERLNSKCHMLIMPYSSSFGRNCFGNFSNLGTQYSLWLENEMIHTYMWDVTSCLYFLKFNNLERHYKVCSLLGHHLYMANVYNMLGGVTITNEVNHYDSRSLTAMMKCIIDQNSIPIGGINLKLIPHRESDLRELVNVYVKYIDAIGKGLRFACGIVNEQVFAKHIQNRYSTYYSGFGSRILNTDVTMEECEDYYKKNHSQHNDVIAYNKFEHFEVVLQRYLDTCDHV